MDLGASPAASNMGDVTGANMRKRFLLFALLLLSEVEQKKAGSDPALPTFAETTVGKPEPRIANRGAAAARRP